MLSGEFFSVGEVRGKNDSVSGPLPEPVGDSGSRIAGLRPEPGDVLADCRGRVTTVGGW
jgi:hypothetical protein